MLAASLKEEFNRVVPEVTASLEIYCICANNRFHLGIEMHLPVGRFEINCSLVTPIEIRTGKYFFNN